MGALGQGSLTEGAGDTTAYTAVSASDTFINTAGMTFLAVDNQSGGNCTVGAAAQIASTTKQGFGNLTKGNVSVVCPTGQTTIIGSFSKAYENSSGQVTVTFSATSSVKARAFTIPNPATIT